MDDGPIPAADTAQASAGQSGDTRDNSAAGLPHRTPDHHQFTIPVRTVRPGPGPEILQRVLDGLHQL